MGRSTICRRDDLCHKLEETQISCASPNAGRNHGPEIDKKQHTIKQQNYFWVKFSCLIKATVPPDLWVIRVAASANLPKSCRTKQKKYEILIVVLDDKCRLWSKTIGNRWLGWCFIIKYRLLSKIVDATDDNETTAGVVLDTSIVSKQFILSKMVILPILVHNFVSYDLLR